MARARAWVLVVKKPRPPAVDAAEKAAIIATCDAFIRDVLKPRFLPVITPTKFNYTIDIHGSWHGGRYRFLQRMRSGWPENLGEEFDHPFARLDRMGGDSFDIQWFRHTETWWKLRSGVTLARALEFLIEEPLLHPV